MNISQKTPAYIHTLFYKPDITIWYGQISDLINCIFRHFTYHSQRPVVNEIFKKEDFRIPLFCDAEINTLNTFKALKKQVEWICGRYLVKQMAQTFVSPDLELDQIFIATLDQGAPFLAQAPDVPISISHSNAYTACAVSLIQGQTIGLDLEQIKEKPDQNFMKIAFTQKEIDRMPDTAEQVFKHWTIKEAYLKYIKKGFNEPLHKVEVLNKHILHHNRKINVDIMSWNISSDYILSLVSTAKNQS